jgi:hypothetical protein
VFVWAAEYSGSESGCVGKGMMFWVRIVEGKVSQDLIPVMEDVFVLVMQSVGRAFIGPIRSAGAGVAVEGHRRRSVTGVLEEIDDLRWR